MFKRGPATIVCVISTLLVSWAVHGTATAS